MRQNRVLEELITKIFDFPDYFNGWDKSIKNEEEMKTFDEILRKNNICNIHDYLQPAFEKHIASCIKRGDMELFEAFLSNPSFRYLFFVYRTYINVSQTYLYEACILMVEFDRVDMLLSFLSDAEINSEICNTEILLHVLWKLTEEDKTKSYETLLLNQNILSEMSKIDSRESVHLFYLLIYLAIKNNNAECIKILLHSDLIYYSQHAMLFGCIRHYVDSSIILSLIKGENLVHLPNVLLKFLYQLIAPTTKPWHDNAVLMDAIYQIIARQTASSMQVRDGNDHTFLASAVAYHHPWEVIETLIEAGSDLHDSDANGPIFMYAMCPITEKQDPHMVKKLLNLSIKIYGEEIVNYQKELTGDTALILAVKYRVHLEIINDLLNAGALVNLKNNKGNTALSLAKALLNRARKEAVILNQEATAQDFMAEEGLVKLLEEKEMNQELQCMDKTLLTYYGNKHSAVDSISIDIESFLQEEGVSRVTQNPTSKRRGYSCVVM